MLVAFLLGLSVGSFLNVLIDRLPRGESVIWGRSHCDHCNKKLRWYELIPVLSYIFQSGRCLRCRKRLSFQYPAVELATGLGFVFLFQAFDYSLIRLFAYLIIFCSLLVIFVADIKYRIIPDAMVIAGVIGAIVGIPGIGEHVLAGMGASLFFYLLWLLGRGKTMGFGDVKLAFLLGLPLGFPYIVIALYGAFLTGAAAGVILILVRKKTLKSAIPFGPFLVGGALAALIWGDAILRWWKLFL